MVLKTAFESKVEDFFRLARKPTDAYFYRLTGGFCSSDGKKTDLVKMGFENRPNRLYHKRAQKKTRGVVPPVGRIHPTEIENLGTTTFPSFPKSCPGH